MSELMTATVAEVRETSQVSRYQRYFFLVAALFLLTIGAALRISHLGNRSLWFDEALTANISRSTVAHVLEKTRRVSAPVVHPYILYVVEKVDQKRNSRTCALRTGKPSGDSPDAGHGSRQREPKCRALCRGDSCGLGFTNPICAGSARILSCCFVRDDSDLLSTPMGSGWVAKPPSGFIVCGVVRCSPCSIRARFVCGCGFEHYRAAAYVCSRDVVSGSCSLGSSFRWRRTIILRSYASLPVSARQRPVVSGFELL